MKIYAVRQTSDSEKIFEELAEKDLWVKVRKVRGSGEVGYFKLANIDDPIAEQKAYYFNFVPAYCVTNHDSFGLSIMNMTMNGGLHHYEVIFPMDVMTTEELVEEMTSGDPV